MHIFILLRKIKATMGILYAYMHIYKEKKTQTTKRIFIGTGSLFYISEIQKSSEYKTQWRRMHCSATQC